MRILQPQLVAISLKPRILRPRSPREKKIGVQHRAEKAKPPGRRTGEAIEWRNMVNIKVKKLDRAAQVPRYAHVGMFGDLAADLYALVGVTLAAGETLPVATGIALEFPATHGALVEDRSGLAVRGVTTLAGVIDPGYRGEIKVVMTNLRSAAPPS